jgi:hypothetical protein
MDLRHRYDSGKEVLPFMLTGPTYRRGGDLAFSEMVSDLSIDPLDGFASGIRFLLFFCHDFRFP